jgi:hypothetical protein
MIKYRTRWNKIEAMEVAGETATQIITQQGRRERKRSDWLNWHDTWEDAHAFLVSKAEHDVKNLSEQLAIANQKLEQVRNMKAPQESN